MKKLWQNKKARADLILILALLLVGCLAFFATRGGAVTQGEVVVTVDGEEVGRYPLGKDAVYALNGGTNTLVIEDGYAWLSEATCPDQLCVHMGRIHSTSGIIVCLPNRLVVTVEGVEDAGVDITVG